MPKGFRPSGDSRAIMRGTDNSGAISFYLYGTPEGKMVLRARYAGRFVGISSCDYRVSSLTQTEVLTLINSTHGTVKGYRRGPLVTLRIDWKSSASGAWNTGNFGTLPESWRPPMDLNFSYGGRDGANQKSINVNANGTMTYANQGGTQGTNAFGMTVSYAL